MQEQRYNDVAIALHWLIGAIIAVAFGLGLSVDLFPRTWDAAVVNTHVLLGMSVLVLTLVRLWWRLSRGVPAFPPQMSPGLSRMARLGHGALYVMMLVVPVIGMPTLFFRGKGIDFGVFQLGPYLARDPSIFRPLTELHELASYGLVLLALGHAAAAIYHHHVLKDRLLERMGLG